MEAGMYPSLAVGRSMKVQEVILCAMIDGG